MTSTTRFRIKLALALGLVASAALGTDRVFLNPESNGDLRIKANIAGTPADALVVTGSTGAVTIGPPATGNFTGQQNIVSGGLKSGNVTSSANSGRLGIGNNVRLSSQNAESMRSQTAPGGSGLLLYNDTTATNAALEFYYNAPGDATSTSGVVAGSFTGQGAWAIGVPNTTATQTINAGTATITVGTNTTQDQTVNVIGGTSGRSQIKFQQNGASPVTAASLGASSGASGHIIGGDAAGDLAIVSNSHSILFSGDNGNTNHGSMTSGGLWTLPNGIKGRTDASLATAGNIGEVLRADSASVLTTNSYSLSNVITISLTAGDWMIFASTDYLVNAVSTGSGAAPYAALAKFDLTNTTDSTTLTTRMGVCATSTNADCTKTTFGNIMLMGKTSISATKTFALRYALFGQAVGSASAANNGQITVNNNGFTNGTQIYAIRLD